MRARHYYVIIDTVNKCLVMVRPQEGTIDVVDETQAADAVGVILKSGSEISDEARESLQGLRLAALAARLCGLPEDGIEAIVDASTNDPEHAANGVCIAVGVDGGTSVTFRADRERDEDEDT